jgi:AbrB family looped-hinge helix DNA binding protein
MMVVRTIQKLHRVAIPPEIWRALGLREGDKVEVTLVGGKIVIFPVTQKSPTEALWNLSKNPTPTDQPDSVIAEAITDRVEKALSRK